MIKSKNKIKANLMKKTKNQIYHNPQKAQKVRKNKRVLMKAMKKESRICLQAVNALINSALQRRSIRKLDREWKRINIDFFARIAIKTTTTIFIVSFVSKYIQITAKMKMMINGLAVITVNAG
jgi:hypothetical protein